MPLELCGGCCILPFCPFCTAGHCFCVPICDPCGIIGGVQHALNPCFVHLPCCPLIACWAGTSVAAVASASTTKKRDSSSSSHHNIYHNNNNMNIIQQKLPSLPLFTNKTKRSSSTSTTATSTTTANNGWWTLWHQDASTDVTSRAMLEQWLLWEVDDESYPYTEGRHDGDNDDETRQPSSNDEQDQDQRNSNEQQQQQARQPSQSSRTSRHQLHQKVTSIWKRSVEATAGAFSLDRSRQEASFRHEHYVVEPMSK